MPFKCSGMQTILNGAIRYRSRLRGELMKQFETVNDHPNVGSTASHLSLFVFAFVSFVFVVVDRPKSLKTCSSLALTVA